MDGEKGLPRFVTKQLLQDIEASGTTREEIDLLGLCNSYEDTYGISGSALRRSVQQRFSKVKGKSVTAYTKYLSGFCVTPGTATRKELLQAAMVSNNLEEEEEEAMSVANEESSRSHTPPPQTVHGDNAAPGTPFSSSHGKTSANVSVADGTPFSPVAYSPQASARASAVGLLPATAAMFSPPSLPTFGSPPSKLGVQNTPSSVRLLSWSSFQDGTRKHPWIVMVNMIHPEAHREFDVQFLLNIKCGKYHRNGFHIRLSCAPQDYDKYEATIPIPVGGSSNYAVEYQKRFGTYQGTLTKCLARGFGCLPCHRQDQS